MTVYLIKASAGSDFSKYKAQTGGPPQSLFSTAAATPGDIRIEMADETIGMKTDFRSRADLVCIFMSTPDAFRAYDIADRVRNRGKTVVLGGLHATFLPEEASVHADALLLGEPEGIWEELLADFRRGELRKRYKRAVPFDMAGKKPYPVNIIPPSRYGDTWSVVVSRGCPNKCEFCLVHKFFEGKYTRRPIADVVDEVRALKPLGVGWVELHADNLTGDRQYALDLFSALAPLGMRFFGETTVAIARDRELLEAARNAGIKALMFGIETPSREALEAQGKSFVEPERIREDLEVVKQYGIEVWGDFLFGFDEHTPAIFEETRDFVEEIGVDEVFPHLVIPFPGSETYRKLEADGRILTRDWSKYDGTHVVFKPLGMSAGELEKGLDRFWRQHFRSRQARGGRERSRSGKSPSRRHLSVILALIAIWAAVLLDVGNLLFGVIFLAWSISGIRRGEAHLLISVSRRDSPLLFWLVSLSWFILSAWSLIIYLRPFFVY